MDFGGIVRSVNDIQPGAGGDRYPPGEFRRRTHLGECFPFAGFLHHSNFVTLGVGPFLPDTLPPGRALVLGIGIRLLGCGWNFGRGMGLSKKIPPLAAAWLYYALTLLPTLGPIGTQAAADRYAYLPCLGLLVPLAWGITSYGYPRRLVYFSACTGLIVLLGILTFRQAGVWKNTATLWEAEIRQYPAAPFVHGDLAVAYQKEGLLDQALEEYRKEAGLSPPVAVTYDWWGVALFQKGRMEEALEKFKASEALDPNIAETHWYLWFFSQQKGLYDGAYQEIQDAIQLQPETTENYNSLGMTLGSMGKLGQAQEAFETALSKDPQNTVYMANLAATQLKEGKPEKALDLFQRAALLQPLDFSWPFKMGEVCLEMGRAAEADQCFQKAIRLNPRDPRLPGKIAEVLKKAGQKGLARNYLGPPTHERPNP